MVAILQKWGNSQGVRLPKRSLNELRLNVGDRLNVSLDGGRIVIEPLRKRYAIADLVAQIPPDYAPSEESFGVPVGVEEW
jgi:antitoxin MazE